MRRKGERNILFIFFPVVISRAEIAEVLVVAWKYEVFIFTRAVFGAACVL